MGLISRVFVMQKRIIRILFDLNYRESCRDKFKTKKIMIVTCNYIFKISCFMHRNLNKFKMNNNIHSYPTRSARELHINNYNISEYKKSPHCADSFYNMTEFLDR